MSDTLAVINYIRKLEARIAALERQEGGSGGSGVGLNDSEGDPANVAGTAADGTSTYAARRDHAHTIAAGTVTAAMMQDGAALAEILDDDGAGSGLDADLLDGQHADAFLEVDGGNYMTGNLGVGVAPSSVLHVRGTNPLVRIDGDAVNSIPEVRFYDNNTTLKGRLLYGGSSGYFGFVNSGATDLRFLSDAYQFWSLSAAHTYVDSSGQWGVGVASPQGKLHTNDGTGRTLIGSKTAITGTAQTIIPDGTGDVTKLLRYEAICSNGSTHASGVGTLPLSGTGDITCGSDTYQLRVNANGSVDIRRTAGSTNGTATYRLIWL